MHVEVVTKSGRSPHHCAGARENMSGHINATAVKSRLNMSSSRAVSTSKRDMVASPVHVPDVRRFARGEAIFQGDYG
jgi:hypothetical protein